MPCKKKLMAKSGYYTGKLCKMAGVLQPFVQGKLCAYLPALPIQGRRQTQCYSLLVSCVGFPDHSHVSFSPEAPGNVIIKIRGNAFGLRSVVCGLGRIGS